MVEGAFTSIEDTVTLNVGSNAFRPKSRSSADTHGSAGRVLNVVVEPASRALKVAVKPALLAQEERQERLNRSIKLGFTPPSRSTAR